MKYAIISIQLRIPVRDSTTVKEAAEAAENYELPHGYVEDSFEFIKLEES